MQDETQSWERGEHRVSTERGLLDVDRIHRYLSEESSWAAGISRELVDRAILGSICFGLYRNVEGEAPKLIGFARVVSDSATFAYLADLFVLPEETGAGLGSWLVECILAHPDLIGLRRWILVTADAHELFKPFGFKPLATPERFMELHISGVYLM